MSKSEIFNIFKPLIEFINKIFSIISLLLVFTLCLIPIMIIDSIIIGICYAFSLKQPFSLIGMAMLPATLESKNDFSLMTQDKFLLDKKEGIDFIDVKYEPPLIDQFGKKLDLSDKDVVIAFNPNCGILEISAISDRVVVNFNYPGVGRSEGVFTSELLLIEKSTFIVRTLIDMGAKPESITFYGLSLGGAVATLTLAKLIKDQEQLTKSEPPDFKKIRLISVNSFTSVTDIVAYKEPFLAIPIKILVKPVLTWMRLNLNAAEAMDFLDTHGVKKHIVRSSYDEVIPKQASIEQYADPKKSSLCICNSGHNNCPIPDPATFFNTRHHRIK